MSSNEEIIKQLRDAVNEFDDFLGGQMRKILAKTMEMEILMKAAKEGRLIDFAKLDPIKYKKTMERLTKLEI